MAFKTPPQEAVDWAERQLPRTVATLTANHEAAVKSLLAATDGPVDPEVTLAAIKEYRERRKVVRATVRYLARTLIAGGAPSGRVCRELGFGRTAMQRFMASDERYGTLIGPGKRPTRKKVA